MILRNPAYSETPGRILPAAILQAGQLHGYRQAKLCEQYWESKGEEIWRPPLLHSILLVFDFTLFGSNIYSKKPLVVAWSDWMSFVRGEMRFVTVSFPKSESKVTERTNLYSASHWFRAAYKSSGRISKLALSFITEHCFALTLLDCVFSFAFPLIIILR